MCYFVVVLVGDGCFLVELFLGVVAVETLYLLSWLMSWVNYDLAHFAINKHHKAINMLS